MSLIDQANIQTAVREALSAWLAELDNHTVQVAIAGATFEWLNAHQEFVAEAIRNAVPVWLSDSASALVTAIAERVARELAARGDQSPKTEITNA